MNLAEPPPLGNAGVLADGDAPAGRSVDGLMPSAAAALISRPVSAVVIMSFLNIRVSSLIDVRKQIPLCPANARTAVHVPCCGFMFRVVHRRDRCGRSVPAGILGRV